MSKQSRLNKQRAEKAKAQGQQDTRQPQEGQKPEMQRDPQQRNEGTQRRNDKQS